MSYNKTVYRLVHGTKPFHIIRKFGDERTTVRYLESGGVYHVKTSDIIPFSNNSIDSLDKIVERKNEILRLLKEIQEEIKNL